jgi:hypothetical protein
MPAKPVPDRRVAAAEPLGDVTNAQAVGYESREGVLLDAAARRVRFAMA